MRSKIFLFLGIILLIIILPAGTPNHFSVVGLTASALSWQCFDDGSLDPCHNNLNGIELVSGTQGWAVGDTGVILQWGGINWTRYNSPTLEDLNAIDMLDENLGWIVGSRGTILTWNGSTWIVSALTGLPDLIGVDAVAPDDAWVIARGGKFYHWDGYAWSGVVSPANTHPSGIEMLTSTDGWAVGSDGIILHWDGLAWNSMTSPTTSNLYSISMVTSTDGWAGSWNGDLIHWDGSVWTIFPHPAPGEATLDLYMESANNGWMVTYDGNANGQLARWDGVAWKMVGQSIHETLRSFVLIPGKQDQGWAVGHGGRLAYWSGTGLSAYGDSNTVGFDGVDAVASDNIWVVGGIINSPGPIMQYDGTKWHNRGSGWLSDVDFSSVSNGWAMGREFMQYASGAWTKVTPPTESGIHDIYFLNNQEGWAVGGGPSVFDCQFSQWECGAILHWNGISWTEFSKPTPIGASLYSVDGITQNDAWVVGRLPDCQSPADCSISLHWDGSQWSIIQDAAKEGLTGVNMLASDDVWVVGDLGKIYHWDGIAWSSVPSPLSISGLNNLKDIKMITPTDGWAVGATGNILHWDGSQWKQVTSPYSSTLNRLGVAAPDDIWAVGDYGVILHYGLPQAQLSVNYTEGAPGSYFTLNGSGFPTDSLAAISVNGQVLGTTMTDAEGKLAFTMSTAEAEAGVYIIEASVNPKASVMFTLQANSPVRGQQGSYDVYTIPTGIAQARMYFPVIRR